MLKIRYVLLFASFCMGWSHVGAQEFLDYETGSKRYEIGGVTIEGAGNRDENAIKSIAGLREGLKLDVPGGATKAVKALYKLKLFQNVEVIQDSVVGDLIYVTLRLIQRPTLSRYSFEGIKNSHQDDLETVVDDILNKGGIVTTNTKELCAERISEFYVEKGHLDASVSIQESPDSTKDNSVKLLFQVDRGERIKISDVSSSGNEAVSDRKIRKLLKGTKRKGTIFRKSKFVKEKFEEDKANIIAHYNKNGYRDVKITKDSIWRDEEGLVRVHLDIEEGNQYFFRDITWKGNSIYTDDQLSIVLGISPGDVYNEELLERRLSYSTDGQDISSLYLDQGYLFFDKQPTEIAVENDSIDLQIRISEGAQATIDQVIIQGNDRTNEHVIRRELRTRPGEKFSRSDIIRSQRQLMNLGYFNPETLDIQTPVNQQRGTVDIEYTLEETPSDQLELSAGYGGVSGLIGTLGVTFNNFSIQNIAKRERWSPLPQGDGQKLSLRIQSNSRFFRSYNFSFTDPWLGGKKANSFTIGGALSSFDNSSFGRGSLKISRFFVGLGSQLKVPDDWFISNTVLNLENIVLDNYQNQFLVSDGNFKNFNIRQTITRSSVQEPIFPRRGSKISLSLQITPPYSLFRGNDYWQLTEGEKTEAIFNENLKRGIRNQLSDGPVTDPNSEAFLINNLEEGRKFDWLEYHKWRLDAEWYFNIVGKFVMAANAKMGFLGSYSKTLGTVPFERYEYGGDGLSNQSVGITGTDIISARGYEDTEFPENANGGGIVFNKFTVEMRYPLSTNPNSTIYMHTFLQGGNVWGRFRDYNPFDLQRSVGAGVRVFLPMFGLLGVDYGFGIDRNLGDVGWSQYGKFNIVLGFEPD